jgi:[acyl-carrier-protein] S-malonyltransferase
MTVAAYVRGEPVTRDEIEARLAQVRSSAFGSRLPPAESAEGRNARRWVTQLVCAERLVDAELGPAGATSEPLTIERALGVGGVAAAVLAARPGAVRVVNAPNVDHAEVRSYYDRNCDLYADRGIGFADARDSIAAKLQEHARNRAFGEWLDRSMARHIVLQPGFEHPADPHHADATHRH